MPEHRGLRDDVADRTEYEDDSGPELEEAGEETAPPRSRRRRALLAAGGAGAITVAAAIVYAMLAPRPEVRLKAESRDMAKVTENSGLREAAYATIRGPLEGDPASPEPAASPGAGAEAAPAVTLPERYKPSPLDPPADFRATAQVEGSGAVPALKAGGREPSLSGAKPRTNSSVAFLLPAAARSREIAPSAPCPGAPIVAAVEKPQPGPGAEASGALLAVRLLGAVYTLRPGSLARLELTHESAAGAHPFKRGTVFIGEVLGGDLDRAYVRVRGYLAGEGGARKFYRLEGEVIGGDGGPGLRGERRSVSSRWARVLDRAARAGTDLASAALGRGAQVVVSADPYGAYRAEGGGQGADRFFVEVSAGATGFVVITALPREGETSAAADRGTNDLTDAELAALVTRGDLEGMRRALPRLPPALRREAERVLAEGGGGEK